MAVVGLALIAAPMLLTMQFAALSNRPDDRPRHCAARFAASRRSRAARGRRHFRHASGAYWGPGRRHRTAGAHHRRVVQLPLCRRGPVILLLWFGFVGGGAFRRGRMLLTATAVACARLCAGPLHAGCCLGIRLGARRQPVSPPGRRQFRFCGDAGTDLRRPLADYIRDGVPRGRLLVGVLASRSRASQWSAAWVVFSGRTSHSRKRRSGGCLDQRPIVAVIADAGARARSAACAVFAAVAVTAITVAELLWWNAAFRLNAEPRAAMPCWSARSGPRSRRARPGRTPRARPPQQRANARASKSWASAAPGRTRDGARARSDQRL